MNQPTFWEDQRMTLTDAFELTAQSLNAFAVNYDVWVIAYSGGKDSSTALVTVLILIRQGRVPRPKKLIVILSDTRLELLPLFFAAMKMVDVLRKNGVDVRIVTPEMDERFFVYMFGRGVPPPSNTFRWCTPQLKIDPMMKALKRVREESGKKVLMLTGVRIGESQVRDARIAVSCGKNGAECGQGWFQEATPEAVADTLAPILHWRVCLVWKFLRDYAPEWGFPTQIVAEAYGGDEAEEINARTGCVGCNLASKDLALDTIIKNPTWTYLEPLKRLRLVYAELKKPGMRLRKNGTEMNKDGELAAKPQRMGPLTMEARRWGIKRIQEIEHEVNAQASILKRPAISLINVEEKARILELIESNTWPHGWSGDESLATEVMDEVKPDGSVQPVMHSILAS